MGSCLSSPRDRGNHPSPTRAQHEAGPTQPSTPSRRQHRDRERTSLERQNAEARSQLLAGRGEAPQYRRHGSWIANPALSRQELSHARKAFWETADTFGGRREVWDTLRAAVDCDDVDTAAIMLAGADLRLLGNGDLIHGCYDTTGFYYKVPENCLSDPANLLKDDATTGVFGTTSMVQEFPESQLVDLKVRLSHNSQDLLVRVAMAEKVSSVSTKIQAATGVKRLKLMVLGKMLKDDGQQTLTDAGWTPGIIVQGLVTQIS